MYMNGSKEDNLRKRSYREGKCKHFVFKTTDFMQVLRVLGDEALRIVSEFLLAF